MVSTMIFGLLALLVCQANSLEKTLEQTAPVYALAVRATNLNATACHRDLHAFREAVDRKKLWSLKMLDSSGEPKQGFLYGNNYWLGVQSQCIDSTNEEPLSITHEQILNNSKYRNANEEFPPFKVDYFIAYFQHNSTKQYHVGLPNEDLVTLGLCLPATCTPHEIGVILNEIFRERALLINDLYDVDFQLLKVKDLKDDRVYTSRQIFFWLIIIMIWGMMTIGTLYDVCFYQKQKKRKMLESFEKNYTNGATYIRGNLEHDMNKRYQQSVLGKVLLYFSIPSNTRIIFNTKLAHDSVPPIHGLRFLTMIWIIMIHTIFYMGDFADNKAWSWRKSEGFGMQVISNSTLSVDTFFFLSGFLVAYLYFKGKKPTKENGPVNYGRKVGEFVVSVLRRYIRLTPAYMLTMAIIELHYGRANETSQFYMSDRPHEICAKYWWRNILYINNLFGRDTMCMSWSWYLSNDMQFFIIGTFLLILSSVYFKVAVVIILFLLTGSTVLTGYISYINNYVPTLDNQYHMLDILYDPPWTRIGPYLVGIMAAYILIKINGKLILEKRILVICWCCGCLLNLAILFGLYNRYISVLAAAIYVATSRTLWAIGIAWILIACCTNHGGIANTILSFKAWVPLSRLTYCAYLLNPLIIKCIYLSSENSAHVDSLVNGAVFFGNFVMTYICGYALCLMIETPNILLMRLIVNGRDKKR